MGRLTPTITTIKKLFALSGNACAFNLNGETCSNKIIDKDNDIIGVICHIEAANEGWLRYNPNSNDEYRRDFENLILLCPNHHKKVDSNSVFTVDVLRQMKTAHELSNKNKSFQIENELLNKIMLRLGMDISIEANIFNSSNLPKYIIEKLLSELDGKEISISNKENLFRELENKYNSLIERVGDSDDKDSVLENLLATGKFEDAENLLKESVEEREKIAQKNSLQAAEKAYQLAILLELQLKYSEAINYYKKSVDLQPENISFLNSLGYALTTIGEYQKSIDIYSKVVELSLRDKIIDAPAIGRFYINLGWANDGIGQYQKAIEYYDKAVVIFNSDKQSFGDELSACYNNIGLAHKNLNKHVDALHSYERALNIYEGDTNPENYKHIANILTNMAALYSLHRNFKVAVKYCEMSIHLYLKANLDNYPEIASTYYQLGFALYCLDEHQTALQYTAKAVNIYLACFGEHHPKVASCYNDFALIYNDMGNSEKAIKFGEKALRIQLATLGNSHPYTITALENLESFKSKQK